ncbi:MAG TPA: hypothetical protein VEA81_09275 [Burkholderiaceae bacterium]|nr:hypothetical protein [Burkholderiaceae bacterium]
MIFSLFGRKDGRGAERRRSAVPEAPSTRPAPAAGGPASRPLDPREIARLTAAKIDEIESEMISAGPGAAASRAASPATRPIPAQAGLAGTVYVPSGLGLPPAPGRAEPAPAPAAPAAETSPAGDPTPLADAGLSMEVAASSLPAAFEEAAVLYSNGQGAAAATVLWQAIKDEQLGGHARQAWEMLFDLYQASGRKDDFESLAIDFSARFETSPPTWDDAAAPRAGGDERPSAPAAVALPASLDAQAVRQLEQLQRFAQRGRAVVLDLAPVRSVDPIGADLLLRVLNAAARARIDLSIAGADSLLELVRGTIEAGRRDPAESGWLLALELLRVLGRQQEFEDLSIDYCVTYEVSPPSWEPMPPTLRPHRGATTSPGAAGRPPVDVGYAATPEGFVLRGELEGRAQDALGALRAYAAERAETILDCRALRRVDFVAAGELLNEIVALRTGGKYLVFRDVNHPVAALLAVMGIPDLAEIRLRRH